MRADEKHEQKQLIREVVTEAVPQAVHATLEKFGFDIRDVQSMQQDMQHLRKMRKGSEAIRSAVVSTSVKTGIGAVVLGTIWALIEGFKTWVNTGMNH